MSLKPKRVDFNSTWSDLRDTVKGVITFSNVPRTVWNDRFTGIEIFSMSKRYITYFRFMLFYRCVLLVCGLSGASGRQTLFGNAKVS